MICKYCGAQYTGNKCASCGKVIPLVRRSTVLDRLMADAEKPQPVSVKTFEQGLKEGYQKGLSEGYQNGLKESQSKNQSNNTTISVKPPALRAATVASSSFVPCFAGTCARKMGMCAE